MLHSSKRAIAPVALVVLAGCAASESTLRSKTSASPSPASTQAETSSFQLTGPQSYTPQARPEARDGILRQIWSTTIGGTDERTSIMSADGAIWVGAKRHGREPSGVYVIDGATGARRAVLPGAEGELVGIALDANRVYSTSLEGEVAATTRSGTVLFRSRPGAPIVTPPTLLDADGDGKLEIAVGDGKGRISLLDGQTGKTKWTRVLGGTIGLGLAAGDLDGDGRPELVAGTDDGGLFVLHAETGAVAWHATEKSPLRAAPVLSDLNDDGKLEVIAGWYEGDVRIFAGATGKVLWSQHVEEDTGVATGIVASPTPLPSGTLLVPTARHGRTDAVLVLRAHDRGFRANEGSVYASPVIGTIALQGGDAEGVVGTDNGELYSFDGRGGFAFLYGLDGAIAAPALFADVQNDGVQELVVATRTGRLSALAVRAGRAPLAGVARGASLRNDGVLPPIDLGWHL